MDFKKLKMNLKIITTTSRLQNYFLSAQISMDERQDFK